MPDLNKKDIRYLNKDFGQFRQNLIDFAKSYFPDTYQDFNESSPGMMFVEMAAYVGDVLSFYTDESLKESMLLEASEKGNILSLAQARGYKPKNTVSSNVSLDVYQLVPSIGTGNTTRPDWNYAFAIKSGMTVGSVSVSGVEFNTTEYVDFRYSSSLDPTEISVYEVDDISKEPTYYLLKKQVKAVSGRIKTKEYEFETPKPYDKVIISDNSIIDIVDATDSDDNTWYHVPYLAQETIFDAVPNLARNDATLYTYRDSTPYLLKMTKTSRRFVTRMLSNDSIEISFGAGVTSFDDEEIIPNPDIVGSSLMGSLYPVNMDIDPTNFLYSKTYGLAPSNTTLTFRYRVGGGVKDNVPSEDLTRILGASIDLEDSNLDPSLVRQIKSSLACTNTKPATGGKNKETLEEIRQNAVASFASQNRAVTKEDYIIRCYAMPPKFGAIAKAHIVQDDQLNQESMGNGIRVENPLALNLYVLGYDSSHSLTQLSVATKENLKTWLNHYRILTDAINIKDAYIINIGVDFEIITLPNFNSNEVLLRCIDKLKEMFDVKKWQINQPIIISSIYTALDRVVGVQTVTKVKIRNIWDQSSGYSGNVYDITEATKDGVIYPSLDPSIFEIKYHNRDISGRVKAY